MFQVPLQCGTFAYGYIVFKGEFIWVNIYSFESDKENDFDKASQCKNLLIRDLMIDPMMFTKSKRVNFTPWKLKHKVVVEEPLPPQHDFYIIGTQESPKVVSIDEENPSSEPASEEDLKIYQKHSISSGRYYTLLIEAKLRGKKVELVTSGNKREYAII